MEELRVRSLRTIDPEQLDALAEVLIDCVEGGASVNFMLPMSRSKAENFWTSTAQSLSRGEREVIVAEDSHGILGTVQVIWAQAENQPHRADVAKMLVHRRARRRG